MNVRAKPISRNLGQVLCDLGVKEGDKLATLLGIHNTNQLDELKSLAAGERLLLGDLLLQAKRLTADQLAEALAKQGFASKQLGQILVDCGYLSPAELEVTLSFQLNQGNHARGCAKLQLGNILVANGDLSHEQLADALTRHQANGGRLGESLIAAGHLTHAQVRHGLDLQRKLVSAVLICALALTASLAPAPVQASSQMAGVQVSAVVYPSARFQPQFQADKITVTHEDIARGYVDMPAASKFTVVTPKGGNYSVEFQPRSDLFHAVSIDGLGSQVLIGSEGGSIAQTGAGLAGATSSLSYRFHLKPNIEAGIYDWPLVLAVRAR